MKFHEICMTFNTRTLYVVDMWSAAQTLFADCFLHRYRLSFTDMSGVRREVSLECSGRVFQAHGPHGCQLVDSSSVDEVS